MQCTGGVVGGAVGGWGGVRVGRRERGRLVLQVQVRADGRMSSCPGRRVCVGGGGVSSGAMGRALGCMLVPPPAGSRLGSQERGEGGAACEPGRPALHGAQGKQDGVHACMHARGRRLRAVRACTMCLAMRPAWKPPAHDPSLHRCSCASSCRSHPHLRARRLPWPASLIPGRFAPGRRSWARCAPRCTTRWATATAPTTTSRARCWTRWPASRRRWRWRGRSASQRTTRCGRGWAAARARVCVCARVCVFVRACVCTHARTCVWREERIAEDEEVRAWLAARARVCGRALRACVLGGGG